MFENPPFGESITGIDKGKMDLITSYLVEGNQEAIGMHIPLLGIGSQLQPRIEFPKHITDKQAFFSGQRIYKGWDFPANHA